MNLKQLLAVSPIIAVTVVASAATSLAHGDGDHHGFELTAGQRTEIREATKPYRDVDVALAAGYIPTDVCTELPGVGGMGYHYVNPGYLSDGVVDPAKPEMLVFHHDRSGHLRLGAVEYMAVDVDQDVTTDDDRPELMGHPFDGPMPGHGPGMPVHYDLHAWVFTHNPAGDLAAWNPRVSCP